MRDALADVLIEIRDRERLSNGALAKRLGVDTSLLTRVFNGEQGVGRKLLDAAIREFPEIGQRYVSSLSTRHDSMADSRRSGEAV